jgi:hypothetical protein
VYENDKIVTENFTKRFVDHRGIAFAAKRISKLAFHHTERRFGVRTLVVVLQELVLAEHEVMKDLLVSPAYLACQQIAAAKERIATLRKTIKSLERVRDSGLRYPERSK